MKALILFFLVGFSLSYNPKVEVSYARLYCKIIIKSILPYVILSYPLLVIHFGYPT